MGKEKFYKTIFLIAAIYDIVLGSAFCLLYRPLYRLILHQAVPIPPVYLEIAAAFVAVSGLGFYFIYRNLYRNIDLAKVGIAMKLIYCLAVIRHCAFGPPPLAYVIFGICDLIFVLIFIAFLKFAKASGKVPA